MNGMEYYEKLISKKAEDSYYNGCDELMFISYIFDYSSGVAKVLYDMSMITREQYIYDTNRIASKIVENTIQNTQ